MEALRLERRVRRDAGRGHEREPVACLDARAECMGRNVAGEVIAAGIHAVIHSRLATGSSDGFRQLLPEFMYFAVLPYFGAEVAGAEMAAASA